MAHQCSSYSFVSNTSISVANASNQTNNVMHNCFITQWINNKVYLERFRELGNRHVMVGDKYCGLKLTTLQ